MLGALPAPGRAAPLTYARANSKTTTVYVPCTAKCDNGLNLLVGSLEFRMTASSRDGRYTAFYALVRQPGPVGDATNLPQLWLHDRKTGVVELASRGLDGKPVADGIDVRAPFGVTADGRLAWFTSRAANLVAADRNENPDVFAYDRVTKKVRRLSLDVKGREVANGYNGVLSADASTVSFVSRGDVLRKGVTQSLLYVKNLKTGKGAVVVDDTGKPNAGFANYPSYLLTPNGRYLVDTDDVQHATLTGFTSMYGLYDLWTGKFRTVPSGERGLAGRASIDASARSIVFDTDAGPVRVDLTTGVTQTVAELVPTLNNPSHPSLSDDGRTMVVRAEGAADPAQAGGGVYAVPIGQDGKAGTPRLLTPLPAPGSCTAPDCYRHLFWTPVVSGDGHAASFLTDQALVAEDPSVGWDAYVVGF
jgi:Tol biopolymer transport system component